jgi:hypothetical protein
VKTVCSWCEKEIARTIELIVFPNIASRVSHGLCPECQAELMRKEKLSERDLTAEARRAQREEARP